MADIDMINAGVPLDKARESTVQSGGGGQIDMLATPLTLNHSPQDVVQKGGGGGSIDMIGEQGLLSHTPTPPQDSKTPG